MQPTVQATYGACEGYTKGGRKRPPFVYTENAPYVACTVGCMWLVCSSCAAQMCPYVASIYTAKYINLVTIIVSVMAEYVYQERPWCIIRVSVYRCIYMYRGVSNSL